MPGEYVAPAQDAVFPVTGVGGDPLIIEGSGIDSGRPPVIIALSGDDRRLLEGIYLLLQQIADRMIT